ncbi:MAG: rod shape-determining protein RodA [Bacteroidia bacterium]|nr:rod shape-determining protein RodA [Bacteroidia bacterium]
MNERSFQRSLNLDTITLGLYFLLVVLGWLTVYAVSSSGGEADIFDFDKAHGKQLVWIGISLVVGIVILAIDYRIFSTLAYVFYGASILLLIFTIFAGKEINGAKAWLEIGGQRLQPAEFAKIATALALARFMSRQGFSMSNLSQVGIALGFVLLPAIIVILQNDTGSALVFGSFVFVFFRKGMSPVLPLLGLASAVMTLVTLYVITLGDSFNIFGLKLSPIVVMVLSIFVIVLIAWGISTFMSSRKYFTRNTLISLGFLVYFGGLAFGSELLFEQLPPHQQVRIEVLFNPKKDPYGAGYNVIQSKIAIGSGYIYGKGYLEGNYTRYRFVPKQETDFIYCTIGEEMGWVGTTFILILFFLFLARLHFMAESGKMGFTQIYGYSCMSIFFFHVLVNVGMTIGFVPVIGIPLPYFSYGGSAMLSFTILLFIMINLYAHRGTVLSRSL